MKFQKIKAMNKKTRNEVMEVAHNCALNPEIEGIFEMKTIKDADGNITLQYEKRTAPQGTAEDYKLSNLINLGVTLNELKVMNNRSRESIKSYIEDFAKGHIEFNNNQINKED